MTNLVPPKPSNWRPSGKPLEPRKPSRSPDLCDTKSQKQALRAADKLLRKAGYFERAAKEDQQKIDPDLIGSHGLKPYKFGRS